MKNINGMVFGRLTVNGATERRTKDRRVLWECVCSCGNVVFANSRDLQIGNTTSCGCYQREQSAKIAGGVSKQHRKMNDLPSSFNGVFHGYKRGAIKRGYYFSLTDTLCYELMQQNCYYCGAPPHKTAKFNKNLDNSFTYNGLDRVDNAKGYSDDNVVPCCFNCNRAKAGMTQQEFLEWVRRVYDFQRLT